MTESIVGLGKSEEWFWDSEPRIVINLINQYKEIEKERMKTQSMYIACCVWGKNPSELEGEDDGVPGIDKPVDPNMLKGFY